MNVPQKELIVDLKDPARFKGVQVEAMKLFSLEQAAMRKKVEEAPLYLLNGVITMIFPTPELANSCGQGIKIKKKAQDDRQPLDPLKIAAIKGKHFFEKDTYSRNSFTQTRLSQTEMQSQYKT